MGSRRKTTMKRKSKSKNRVGRTGTKSRSTRSTKRSRTRSRSPVRSESGGEPRRKDLSSTLSKRNGIKEQRKPRNLTDKRKEKIKEFLKEASQKPDEYGKAGSTLWMDLMIEHLQERGPYSVGYQDIEHWMKMGYLDSWSKSASKSKSHDGQSSSKAGGTDANRMDLPLTLDQIKKEPPSPDKSPEPGTSSASDGARSRSHPRSILKHKPKDDEEDEDSYETDTEEDDEAKKFLQELLGDFHSPSSMNGVPMDQDCNSEALLKSLSEAILRESEKFREKVQEGSATTRIPLHQLQLTASLLHTIVNENNNND